MSKAQSISFLLSQVRASGVALAGGEVEFFAAGTSTPKLIWLDRNKAVEAANPYTLDANGTAPLFGDGIYRMVIRDSTGAEKYDRDGLSFRDASSNVYDVADYASLTAAVASIGSTPATLQFASDVTVSANLTTPSTLELLPLNGAKINHGAYTISYAGSTARWPLTQVFNGTGAVTGLAVSRPQWFGGKADDTTDSGAAINKAAASCTETLVIDGGPGRYATSIAIVIPAGINVDQRTGITNTAASGSAMVGMTIGSKGVVNQYANLSGLDITRTNLGTWGDAAHIGLLLYNCNTCNVSIKQVSRFGGTNFKAMGSGAGFSYNEITLGDLGAAQNELLISNETYNSVAGWVNENNWYGGRFWVQSAVTNSVRYGVTITSDDGTYLSNNNNHFWKPSFELGTSKSSISFVVEHGFNNYAHGIRNEGNDLIASFRNASTRNTVESGYDLETSVAWEDTSSAKENHFYTVREQIYLAYNKLVFRAANLAEITDYYNGSSTFYTQGMAYNQSGTITNVATDLVLKGDGIEVKTRPIGVKVDTAAVKEFLVKRSGSNGGRVLVVPYDSNGAVLTSGGANHPYVVGRTGADFNYTASYGGGYLTGTDSTLPQVVTLGTDVKSAWIGIADGSGVTFINSFAIYTNAADVPTVTTGATPGPNGVQLASAVPTVGTHNLSDRFVNAVPTVGQPKGWVCTVAGTFGTLAGVTGSITSGTKTLTVNDATGIEYGMYITIVGVSGVKRVTGVSGLNIQIDTAAGATVTGAAVAYQAPTLVSEGNL